MDSKDLPAFTLDDLTLDLGYGAVPPSQYTNITSGSGTDTITLDPSWSTGSITVPTLTTTGSMAYTGSYNFCSI